jgi:hypothetical protein
MRPLTMLAGRAEALAFAPVAISVLAIGAAGCASHVSGRTPTFGRPTIVGVQAGGNSEPGLRIDTHGRVYVTSPFRPYSAVWRSLDGGETFKWVPAADATTGRLATCRLQTGGDSEIATDSADRLYFSDRFSAQASPYNTAARSDDHGATFASTCNAVTSKSTDRPWYAVDGDPLPVEASTSRRLSAAIARVRPEPARISWRSRARPCRGSGRRRA